MSQSTLVSLRYDRRMLSVQLPTENLLGVLDGNFPAESLSLTQAQQLEEVARSIREPIGCGSLKETVEALAQKTGKAPRQLKVVVMASDLTRPSPTYKILPPLVQALNDCGIVDENILVMFGLGSHRNHTPQEQQQLMGEEMYRRIRCVDSVPGDFVYLATTSRGTPLNVNRLVLEADLRIATGNVDYHWFAGYSAGAKAFFPGACRMDSVQQNHKMAVLPQCHSGALKGNPLREDIDEAGGLIGIHFIVNVVINDLNQQILRSFAGDYLAAHRAACRFVDEVYGHPIPQLADVVVASSGGFPKDINIDQMQKALENAFRGVKPGGTLLITAACPEGYGKPAIGEAFRKIFAPQQLLAENMLDPAPGVGAKEGGYAKVSANCHVVLVTDMAPGEVRNLFWEPCSPDNIQQKIDSLLTGGKTVYAMPLACSVMPVLNP